MSEIVSFKNMLMVGKDENTSKEFFSGIVFKLSKKTSGCKVYKFDDWEVEVNKSDYIVARSINVYTCKDIHSLGHSMCEKALDAICIKGGNVYHVEEPYSRYVEVFFEKGHYSLILHDSEKLTFEISAAVSIMDKDGNIIHSTQKKQNEQDEWVEMFRYYRFSKGSNNVYDAYRWMFLVFECLMQLIDPINLRLNGKPAESEQAWIGRALNTADARYQWISKFNWSITDNIGYFILEQYQNIRCRLFHAKGSHILPNEQLEQKNIQEKLLELESICWYLLSQLYSTSKNSGGLTDYGFTKLKDVFNDTTAFMCNEVIDPKEEGAVEFDDSVILLKEDLSTLDVNLRNITKLYRTDLDIEKEYMVNSYGIMHNNEIIVYGNRSGFELAICGVSKIILELQTHIANQGESFKYIK